VLIVETFYVRNVSNNELQTQQKLLRGKRGSQEFFGDGSQLYQALSPCFILHLLRLTITVARNKDIVINTAFKIVLQLATVELQSSLVSLRTSCFCHDFFQQHVNDNLIDFSPYNSQLIESLVSL
jgi:hypothetical protein